VVLQKDKTSSDKIEVPSNFMLFRKKYRINKSFSISKSYPYYISKVSSNYIFIKNDVYKISSYNSNYYTNNMFYSDFHKRKGIVISVLNDGVIAQIERKSLKQENSIGVLTIHTSSEDEVIEVLDLDKVYKLFQRNMYWKPSDETVFIEVSDYMIKINVKDKVQEILEEKYTDKEKIDSYTYYYDLVEHNAILYVLVFVTVRYNDAYKVDIVIF
jgi:hypothetical protein